MADRHNPPRGWRGASGTTPASGAIQRPAGSSSKRKQIFTILAVMLALVGGVLGLLYLIRPAPRAYFVPLFITEYKFRQIPVNFLAEPDREALVEGKYFEHMSTFGRQERNQIVEELAKLKERKQSDALVLYVCAFARASEKGEVLLLPGDFNPDDSQSAVSLRDALQMLRECPAGHKFLIMDTMRPLADSRLGVLANDVASRIPQDLEAVPDSNRMVLLSCSPGQVSHASEDLGRSVFGYYVEEGLRGWADGFNADGKRDGHVSARELAEFVKRRVDRWAEHNRGSRQTPTLIPQNPKDDFQMVALEHGRAQAELQLPEPGEYLKSLKDAWKERDDAWSDDSYQLCPRAFREFEAYLLRAELEWRGGMKLDRLEPDLKGQVDRFKGQLAQAREFFQGEPRSLTLARALGRKSDPTVAVALKDVVAKADLVPKDKPKEAEPTLKKLITDFLDKNKGKQFDVACAAFDLAADDANPTADKIRFLAQLLQTQDSHPRYVETLAIYRLAEMANYLRAWPATTARRALEMTWKGELAVSRPRVLPWIRSLLEEAAQDRHTAEVFLWTLGCVSVDVADSQLKKAAEEFDVIRAFEDALLQAQRSLDEALIRLPAMLPYLEGPGHGDEAWRAAVDSAQELHAALAQFPDPKQKVAVPDLKKKLDGIRQKADTLRSQMDAIQRPFTSESLQQIITRSKQPDANASIVVDIQSMLATPILKGPERINLWSAGRALSGRLSLETMKLDEDEDQRQQATKALSDFEPEQKRWERTERERAAHRAGWSIALLKLCGLPSAEADKLEESRKQALDKSEFAPWDALAVSLRKAWIEDIPRKLAQETNLAAKDRLNAPYPPFDIGQDDPNPNAVLLKNTLELKEWLTRWYQYENQDLPSSGFYAASVSDYRGDGRMIPAASGASIQFSTEIQISPLTPAHPSERVGLQLKLVDGAAVQPVAVNIFTADDDWLQVAVLDKRDLANLTKAGSSCTIPIEVALKGGAQTTAALPPQGFLVQARVNDRVFHYKVSVPLVPRPEVLLSTNATEPKDPINELTLRPGKERLKYYLYVRNHTKEPYKLKVQLLDVEGGEFVFPDVLKPNDPPRRVEFGKVSPPPDKPLKDFQGPLQIRLVDLDSNKELYVKQIPVRIASPRDYVEVTEAVFNPNAGGKNKLTVKLRAKQDIPDGCQVELVLPADRIPGLLGLSDDKKVSEKLTKKDDEEKELFAAGIQLDEGSNPNGFFYLTVDGVPRAFIFKTTFNRDGARTPTDRFDGDDIRLQASSLALPSDKFPVEAMVDNPPEGATVLLELGKQAENGAFEMQKQSGPTEARYQHLGISAQSLDGALLFEANIGDRTIFLDTQGIVGKRILRASLKRNDGTVMKTALRPITLDDSPPIISKVQGEPQGNNIVEATAEGNDPESGVQKVRFYVGKPQGKIPPKSDPLEATFDPDKKAWTRMIPVPPAGDVDLTVEFENGVELKSLKAFKVTMNGNAGGVGGQGKLGSIQVLVQAAERKQPGAKVFLAGGNMKEIKEGTVDASSRVTFDKVPPGTYQVSAVGIDGKATGKKTVTVVAGKREDVTVDVSR